MIDTIKYTAAGEHNSLKVFGNAILYISRKIYILKII
jgi:hypothetical protein